MKQILVLFIVFVLSYSGLSQNRAPSCWLKYKDDFQGDILINTVRVPNPSPTYTYYCTLQWNAGMEGGGYCGIQEHPDGRNYIYSIWDPKGSSDPIKAAYTHPGTKVLNFGGEGTGLKSWNFAIGWDTDQWYSFVTRSWDSGKHTMFGYWVFDHANSTWHHLVTMDFPVKGVRFNSSTGSFVEDWMGTGWNIRRVHQRGGWKRKTSDNSWYSFARAKFERVSPDEGAENYIDNYDGGVDGDHYFMKSGGDVTPVTNVSGATIYLSNPNISPVFEKGKLLEITHDVPNDTTLSLFWKVDTTKAPQYLFHLKIFDNAEFIGTAVIEKHQVVPHQREVDVDLKGLKGDKLYYFQFYIEDIFDQRSDVLSDSFRTSPQLAIKRNKMLHGVVVSPNPVKDVINIKSEEMIGRLNVQVINLLGSVVIEKEFSHVSNLRLPVNSIANGIYFLRLHSGKRVVTMKIIKK